MRVFLLLILVMTAFALAAFPNQIAAVGQDNHLFSVIPTTGALTDFGALPTPAAGVYGDIAYNALTGKLYVVSFDPNAILDSILYSVPLNNPGGATVVGDTGVIGLNSLVVSPAGTMYAIGGANLNQLYTINQTTGGATLVGSGTYKASGDLEFSPSGTLYLTSINNISTDTLFSINPATGAGTVVGNVGFANVFALAFDPTSGIMYGFTNPGTSPGTVISINLSTGVGTSVTTYDTLFNGATEIVPEPDTLGIMAFGWAAIGWIAYRRRRSAAQE